MAGDLPQHAMGAEFKPLRDDMITGRWNNRHLLLLPLAGAATVASQGVELARGTGVDVRTTPLVARPADAWSFIDGTWARLREQPPQAEPPRTKPGGHFPRTAEPAAPRRAAPARPAAAADDATQPMPLAMRPMPEVPTTKARAQERAAAAGLLDRYVHQLSELTGMVSC